MQQHQPDDRLLERDQLRLPAGIERLVFLRSSSIYPKYASQPIVENALLVGSLEPTNQWYALAKLPDSCFVRLIGGSMG